MTIKRSILMIVLVTVALFGSALSALIIYRYLEKSHAKSDRYAIKAIAATGREYSPLPIAFIVETLGLSADQSVNLMHFDLEEGREKLLGTHLIREATIEKAKPHSLVIDCAVRHPVAFTADYEHTAVDREGVLFSAVPFFATKSLLEIYFGHKTSESIWGSQVDPERLALALDLLSLFDSQELKFVDLSHIDEPSLGKREIILQLHDQILLRLTPKRYRTEVQNYRALHKSVPKGSKPTTIDLRIPKLGFMVPITGGHKAYLDWIDEDVDKKGNV